MPINLPNLDDRRYADLIQEARAMIVGYAPEWTNHNPSDPGITLLELFAYLTEMLLYRLNRVTDANRLAFLKLLNQPGWKPSEGKSLDEEIRDTALRLREPYRPVTRQDFESLVLSGFSNRVARARCVPRRNLESTDAATRDSPRPGHISVIIVPPLSGQKNKPQPSSQLIQDVIDYLEPRRLVTTRIHVVGPVYFTIGVRLTVVPLADTLELDDSAVRAPIENALRRFFDPLVGGPEGTGWPFGRNVYISEIYELLDVQPGVDYVKRTVDPQDANKELDELTVAVGSSDRLKFNSQNQLMAVEIKADELVDAQVDITIVRPN
jgi:hypothetical protein